MKKTLHNLLAGACLLTMTACAPGPYLHVTNAVANGGSYELGPEMRNRHMIASVGYDETYAANYPRIGRNVLFVQGIVEGTPEHDYRVAVLTMGQIKGALWHTPGTFMWITGAVIPDNIPLLKAYDLVEFRQVTGNRSMQDFSKTGEGNVVVKVLCRKADADYQKCADALPQLAKAPSGDTGIPYPASVREYGQTYTPAYDAKGVLVRPISQYQPKR